MIFTNFEGKITDKKRPHLGMWSIKMVAMTRLELVTPAL
jgi:hypothetical protein